MRTLFLRILIWFIVSLAVTTAAFVITTALTISEPRGRQSPLAQLMRVEARVARAAYESGGREALETTLNRFAEDGALKAYFSDASGRDLVSGVDRSDLVRAVGTTGGRISLQDDRTVLARASDDGKYWFFLELPRRRFFIWFLHPHYLWILGIAVLLCYVLARSLTAPLRRLQNAVQAFGQGDLSARVRSKRRDEMGELSKNFDHMADRLQLLMTAERRLLADVSHELRSPLARLSVAVELARTGEDREAALSRIQREADRLNTLVGELLQVTRAELDPSMRRKEGVLLDQLVTEIVEDSRIETQARDVSLNLEPLPEIKLEGDPELLRRGIENVIRNAIKYAPAGSAVDVNMHSNPGRILISVRDRGPGVPEGELARIFDPFYRVEADRNRTTGGVGLGLAIARRAVELHNGFLRAKNVQPGLLVEIELLR